jgi:hypothetical protein
MNSLTFLRVVEAVYLFKSDGCVCLDLCFVSAKVPIYEYEKKSSKYMNAPSYLSFGKQNLKRVYLRMVCVIYLTSI